jgi:hypothetical protein
VRIGSEDFEHVLVVKACRVAGVAHYEADPVVVHPTLASPHKQVGRLAERGGRVDEWSRDRGRAIGRRRPQLILVTVTSDPVTSQSDHVNIQTEFLNMLFNQFICLTTHTLAANGMLFNTTLL